MLKAILDIFRVFSADLRDKFEPHAASDDDKELTSQRSGAGLRVMLALGRLQLTTDFMSEDITKCRSRS